MLTVDIVDLRRPEQQHDEEVAAGQEGDEQDQSHGPLRLAEQLPRSHGVRRVDLPDEEGHDECQADEERRQDMRATPRILPSASAKSSPPGRP